MPSTDARLCTRMKFTEFHLWFKTGQNVDSTRLVHWWSWRGSGGLLWKRSKLCYLRPWRYEQIRKTDGLTEQQLFHFICGLVCLRRRLKGVRARVFPLMVIYVHKSHARLTRDGERGCVCGGGGGLWIKTEETVSHRQNNHVKKTGSTLPVRSGLCTSLIAVSTTYNYDVFPALINSLCWFLN